MEAIRKTMGDSNRGSDRAALQVEEVTKDELQETGNLLIEVFTPQADTSEAHPLNLIHQRDHLQNLRRPVNGLYLPNRDWVDLAPADIDAIVADLDAELEEILTSAQRVHNLITQSGDQYYGERASGIASPPAQVAAMKLGTGSTGTAKTGAGAALITYLSGSDKAIDGSFPTSALSGSSRRIQWKTSWGAGVVNGSALREVVIVNDLADATSTAANTYSRALFGPTTLGASDTIAITWNHDLLGA